MANLPKPVSALLALLLGGLLAEGFLRLLVPVEAHFETWFTPGIEEWDDAFGAVYRPFWSGTMRHSDGVYRGVPLELDQHGFRPPARNELPGEPVRVLLLGGRSAMMSYGLPEAETIHARLAAATAVPMEVQSSARAGGNLIRSWNLYRSHLADKEWDFVILSHVNPYLPVFRDHEAFDTVPEPPSPEWVFQYMDGIQLWRDGLFQKTGSLAFQSYLGYGLIRLADASHKIASARGQSGEDGLAGVIRRQAEAPSEEALADYRAFLKHIKSHFEERGIPLLLHFIPRPHAEPDHHAPYREALCADFEVIDLHQALHPHLGPEAFIANGHYNRQLAEQIGRALAAEVSSRLFPEGS